jgi:TonB family protein
MSATYDIEEEERGRFRRFLIASAAVHFVLLLLLALGPQCSSTPQLPAAITVDLLAAPGPPPAPRASASAPKAAKPAPVPAPPAPTPPPPVAKPEPVPPPPASPPPVAKPAPPPPPPTAEKVLPKESAKAPEQAKPAPAPAKPAPAPPPPAAKPAPPQASAKPAAPQKQANIDDVLSQLRAEAGESAPAPVDEARLAPADVSGTGAGGGSVKVSPEVMAWLKSARIHVRRSWVLSPGFRLEPLATQIRVNLDAAGNVVGEPVIMRKSGNPWYDESVLRAIQKASPLPAPPKAGEWDFLFQPEES